MYQFSFGEGKLIMKYETSEELLKDEYLETYNKIKLYATVSGVITVSDEILCDMVEILLTAQKNETPVENIVGKDMQEFCESLFSVISKEDRIKIFLRKLFQFSVIFFSLN